MDPACQAAVEVAESLGIAPAYPRLLQETNNTVLWLDPHPIVAKVGTRPESHASLRREHAVADYLDHAGAPVAAPWPNAPPTVHAGTGFVVTLWRRLEGSPDVTASPAAIGDSLRELHKTLSPCGVHLPNFRLAMDGVPAAIGRTTSLTDSDRTMLAGTYTRLVEDLDRRTFDVQPLHGEPHEGNIIVTKSGIHWIDFENSCMGPVEWDLAFLPSDDDLISSFPAVDHNLLALLRVLCSALVATWCWIQARFPEMRAHGIHHLEVVRQWQIEHS